MKNKRLTQHEISDIERVIDKLERLSKSNSSSDSGISVYDIAPFHTYRDKKTVDSVADSVRICLQTDIHTLKKIITEKT